MDPIFIIITSVAVLGMIMFIVRAVRNQKILKEGVKLEATLVNYIEDTRSDKDNFKLNIKYEYSYDDYEATIYMNKHALNRLLPELSSFKNVPTIDLGSPNFSQDLLKSLSLGLQPGDAGGSYYTSPEENMKNNPNYKIPISIDPEDPNKVVIDIDTLESRLEYGN